MLRRVVLPCLASLLVYAALFGAVLDRPLSLGMFRQLIDAKLARGAATEGPKLVIVAGSNGPYSHRCEIIEPLLGMPCVNAGIAVGIGLDYLFARWRPLLHRGDVVYMPLEEAQFVRPTRRRLWAPTRKSCSAMTGRRWRGWVPNGCWARCSRSTRAPG